MGDSPITNTIKNVAGYGVGTLAAIDTIKGGGLGNYLLNRQRLLSDPSYRSTLIDSPFMSGVMGLSHGPTPAAPTGTASGGVVQPADMVGPPPPDAAIAAPQDARYLPTGGHWYPAVSPLDYTQQVKAEQDRSTMIGLTSTDPGIRTQSKLAIGVPLTTDEQNQMVGAGRQLVTQAGPGSQVQYKTQWGGVTVGSPYIAGNYLDKNAAEIVAARTGGVAVPSPSGGWEVKTPEKPVEGEYSSKEAADAARTKPNQESVLTGRTINGQPSWYLKDKPPAGVTPLEQRTPTTGGPPATIATRTNNPGNIKDGPFARSQPGYVGAGPPATDGGTFAVFNSPDAGHAAMGNLLRTPAYQQLPVGSALNRWSGGGYGGEVAQAAGIDPTRPMSSLSEAERTTLTAAMAQREGFQGTPAAPPAAVAAATPAATPAAATPTAPAAPAATPAQPAAPATPADQPAVTPATPAPPPPPPPPPHEVVRQNPDGSFSPVKPATPPAPPPAPRRIAAMPLPAPPLLAAAAPPSSPLFQFPWQTPTAAVAAPAPVMVARAEPPPYEVVPGAELGGAASGAPPAPAEQRGPTPPPTPPAPASVVPFDQAAPGQPAPGTGATPAGMPAGTQEFTETRPLPADVGGSVTVSGKTPAALDYERRQAEINKDVERKFGKIPEAKDVQAALMIRSPIDGLLTAFPKPEDRGAYLGVITPYLKQFWGNDPQYQHFIALNDEIRSAMIAAGAPKDALDALPTGMERTPGEYEAKLRSAADTADRMIAGQTALANMHTSDLSAPDKIQKLLQYMSSPSAVHYGPYPWTDEQAQSTPPSAPPTSTSSPFLVDRTYTVQPPPQ